MHPPRKKKQHSPYILGVKRPDDALSFKEIQVLRVTTEEEEELVKEVQYLRKQHNNLMGISICLVAVIIILIWS